MSEAEVRTYLDSQQILNVATIGPTGHPHIVAMWYAFVDNELCFWTFAKSQKILNLRRNSKMSGWSRAAVARTTSCAASSWSVMAESSTTTTGCSPIGKAVGQRYNGDAALSDAALPFIEAQARKRLGVAFEVSAVVSWDHTKLGGGY